MTPARDRLARILMIILGIATVGAFANAALEFRTVAPDRVNVEVWRMSAFLVFAGLFTLLGLYPRRMTGVWELVFAQKAGVAVFLAFFAKTWAGPGATLTDAGEMPVDSALAGITFFCYVLTQGWRAWLAPRGDVQ